MFDIGFFELVVIAVVGLLVLGPERLPHAVRMGAAYLGRFRRAVTDVRDEFEREVNLHEMQQRIKQQAEETGLQETQQSLVDLKNQLEQAIDIEMDEPESKTKPDDTSAPTSTESAPSIQPPTETK